MIKHTQTIRRLLPTNWLSVFDHFVGLALNGLRKLAQDLSGKINIKCYINVILLAAHQYCIYLLRIKFKCIRLSSVTVSFSSIHRRHR